MKHRFSCQSASQIDFVIPHPHQRILNLGEGVLAFQTIVWARSEMSQAPLPSPMGFLTFCLKVFDIFGKG